MENRSTVNVNVVIPYCERSTWGFICKVVPPNQHRGKSYAVQTEGGNVLGVIFVTVVQMNKLFSVLHLDLLKCAVRTGFGIVKTCKTVVQTPQILITQNCI